MLVLFDQGTPVPLRRLLKNHTVKTAAQQGWSTLENGDLLRAAEQAGFEELLTTDKNLIHHKTSGNESLRSWRLGMLNGLSFVLMFKR